MNNKLRLYSKFVMASTLFLIFMGGMVTSTGTGLSVPDWPLSYGTLFPRMTPEIFWEHTHRVIAGTVALFTFALTVWLHLKEKRKWVRNLGYFASFTVILQAVLGGMTVLFYLPTPVSMSHAILGQTFFVLLVIIAYAQSREWKEREKTEDLSPSAGFFKWGVAMVAVLYLQLFLGALMRHTGSGLAIPDFPMMANQWWPAFNSATLDWVNTWKLSHGYDPVELDQIFYHFLHRAGAVIVTLFVIFLNVIAYKEYFQNKRLFSAVLLLDLALFFQFTLGIAAVLTQKHAFTTSFHVAIGALMLGLSVLICLRCYAFRFNTK